MTESEAIEAIQFDLKIGGEIHSQVLRDAVGVAIQALEKQIPKKPDFTEDKEFALCPCCNGKGLLNKQKYCDNCGQKIDSDWSDKEWPT
nr:MAG TPA: zinc-ribbon containing domain protein [Caudoviricetes sp.]